MSSSDDNECIDKILCKMAWQMLQSYAFEVHLSWKKTRSQDGLDDLFCCL